MALSHESIPGYDDGAALLAELRPYVRQFGADRRRPWKFGRRKLLDYLIVYIAEGRGRFTIAGEDYPAAAGDLFWIPPNTLHTMEGFPPSMVCPYAHFDLVYRPPVSHWDFTVPPGMTDFGELAPLMHPDMSHTPLGRLCGKLTAYNNGRIGELLFEIAAEGGRAQPYASLRMSALMLDVLAEVLRGLVGISADCDPHVPQLLQAADFLRRHCHEQVSVEQAAEVCGLSPSHFRKLFAAQFGCSPRTYLRRARIMRAKQLLIGSPTTLSRIAIQCGFASVHSFSRAFHASEGLPPSLYRRGGKR